MILSLSFITIILAIVYIALVLYMRKGWLEIPTVISNCLPVKRISIIIAARNEENGIARTIDAVLNQKFPPEQFELIVIDDHSTDRTSDVVLSYAHRGVQLIQLNESNKLNSYKKLAIAKAIDLCTGEIIVTTDADCRMGENWLMTIISYFETQDLYLLSSPVVYSEEKSFFERLQTLEFLYLIGLGAAGIGNKNPTTCNGANLAYRKDIFYEMGGFAGIDELASGDDELFLHKVAAKYPHKIGFCKSTDAVVYTDAKPTIRSFISQRKRWASKSTKYKNKAIVLLGITIWLFNFCMLTCLIVGLFYHYSYLFTFLVVLIAKIIVEYLFIQPLTQFSKREELMRYLPILSSLHIIYLVYIGILGNIGKYDWKGRQVK
ncbi:MULTISPECIES: glycosyltransferase [unclassified Sphingobacterium]|uniref:glycosyltransferase family 2 protein n=1 Tax=unclassified Sphingobacterium TaxID=2609468 RepID=UPI0010DF7A74|nr:MULTISPECIES: glycosyltransferase [unclassified Sphingobacterium]TCR03714.1 cellulose synthase/poly-beta-1,6-N-acetylglucosamine synthase-like glycosyltransferase [Sphingobacterium sp. JUb20]